MRRCTPVCRTAAAQAERALPHGARGYRPRGRPAAARAWCTPLPEEDPRTAELVASSRKVVFAESSADTWRRNCHATYDTKQRRCAEGDVVARRCLQHRGDGAKRFLFSAPPPQGARYKTLSLLHAPEELDRRLELRAEDVHTHTHTHTHHLLARVVNKCRGRRAPSRRRRCGPSARARRAAAACSGGPIGGMAMPSWSRKVARSVGGVQPVDVEGAERAPRARRPWPRLAWGRRYKSVKKTITGNS